jgi:mannose-1-phosphate guanylyltransferase/phosphomannomutase
VSLNVPGIRLRGNVWLGEGVELDDLEQIEAPAFVGNYCRIGPGAAVGRYSVLGASVHASRAGSNEPERDRFVDLHRPQCRDRGRDRRRELRHRHHVLIKESAAIGDEVALGAQSVVHPGVRIYPYKEVETGSQVTRT